MNQQMPQPESIPLEKRLKAPQDKIEGLYLLLDLQTQRIVLLEQSRETFLLLDEQRARQHEPT